MNKLYTWVEFEKFAKGIKKASDIVRSQKPDFVFAPVTGAVPFIDLFFIVDRHFPLDSVEYPPNSSRFKDREGLMSLWYQNFLNANYKGQPLDIVCVDEVISGASAVKGYQEFQKALYEFKRRRGEDLEKKISYHLLGIAEMPANGIRNHIIKQLVNSKKAQLINVGKILTCDNLELNHVRLKREKQDSPDKYTYSPEIEKFYISEHYLTLLQNFASYVGADTSKVTAQNLGKIRDSLEKYLVHH